MEKTQLDDNSIIGRIEQEESTAYGINDAALADARELALQYYNGEPFGNEIEGRSQVVSRDVLDVVESALPQLLKVFVSGDQVVKFEPKGPEDEKASEQETDYINHVVMEKNNGFALFYTWFKDSLISKNGYVKAYFEEAYEVEEETYQGLTDGQLQMLLQDGNAEVIEHSAYPDQQAGAQLQQAIAQLQGQQDPNAQQQLMQLMQLPEPMLHDVKVRMTKTEGCIRVDNCAPEDMMVSSDCRQVSVQNARFVQHRAIMCRAEIEQQGWDIPDNLGYTNDSSQFVESSARDLYNEQANLAMIESDEILVRDTYIRINGELKRYVVAGHSILHKEDAQIIPFAVITPHVMPHRHIGMSYSDLCEDIQLIKSTLVRGQLDNMYLLNNGRHGISDRVNMDDMLTSRPGGVVRISGANIASEIVPLQHTPFPPTSFSMVEYFDSVKEKRTGITAYNQGMDADTLNKTATGVSQIMNAAQQRLELVARTFAETGVKELFMLVHRLVRTHYTKPDIVRIRDEWVDVDPRQWKTRTDMSITVGLGTGNKDQQLGHLTNIYQMQMGALQAGLPIITPINLYNTLKKIATNAGFKQSEEFVTDPAKVPPKPPPVDPKVELEKAKLQADAQKFQAQTQIEQQNAEKASQQDMQKFQAQAEIDRRQAEQNWQQEQLRSQNDLIINREKIAMEAQLRREEMESKERIAYRTALISAESAMNRQMASDGSDLMKMAQQGVNDASQEMQRRAAPIDRIAGMHEQQLASHNELMSAMKGIADSLAKPKKIKRDAHNRISGIE